MASTCCSPPRSSPSWSAWRPTRAGLVSRQEIIERAWDEHWYGPTKVLDVHLAALRRKLGDHSLIETVYGHGFRLAEP